MAALFLSKPWTIEVGDPYLVAWILTAGHLLTSILGWIASRPSPVIRNLAERRAWLFIVLVHAGFGVNKELDLHVLFIQTMRDVLRAEGLQPKKETYLRAFLAAALIVATFAVTALFLKIRSSSRWLKYALAGSLTLTIITLFDEFPNKPIFGILDRHVVESNGLLHTHVSDLVELTVLGFVIWAAYRFLEERKRRQSESLP